MSPGGKRTGGLARRLERLKEHAAAGGAIRQSASAKADQAGQTAQVPSGWEKVGEYVWRRFACVVPACSSTLGPTPLTPEGASVEDMTFIDIETTGLSGGAGTVAFLVGIGRRSGSRFCVEQLFLRDYPGEPDFLAMLLDRFREDPVFVSYNGKSFDTQILKSRFIMNGMQFHFRRQLDLLHPSRRLWASMLDSCSLGSIEEHILGVTRELDVPGSMVPDIYFDFLKTGDSTDLAAVFAHHFEDVVSLERLLAHLHHVLTNPLDSSADPYQLGRWFLKTGFSGGVALLRTALAQGNRRAGYILGAYFRRKGDFSDATSLWESMFARWKDRFAALELAKFHEHRARDYAVAEKYVDYLIVTSGTPGRYPRLESVDKLQHRRTRIRRKAEVDDYSPKGR